jgi:hypothetical protein
VMIASDRGGRTLTKQDAMTSACRALCGDGCHLEALREQSPPIGRRTRPCCTSKETVRLPFMRRAWWEACDTMGQRVWVVVPAALIAALIPIAVFGWKWDETTWATLLAASLAYPALLLLAFLDKLVTNRRHPEIHDEWLPEQSHFWTHPEPHIIFSIRHKVGAPYLIRHECSVRHPNGRTFHASSDTPGSGFRWFFRYPSDFPGADPPVAGPYEVSWRLPGRGGRVREVLRYSETVKEGE